MLSAALETVERPAVKKCREASGLRTRGLPCYAHGPVEAPVARIALFLTVLLSIACGPAAATTLRPTLTVGPDARTVFTLTDLEEARDVAISGGTIYVATDDGLLAYASAESPPTRVGRAEGLPSDDVTSVAVDGAGLLVGTGGGLASVSGGAATPVVIPATARITDVAVLPDGSAWVCSLSGLLRRDPSSREWSVVGEPFHCTTLAPTPEGQLWAGSDAGVFYFETDAEGIVVREHGAASNIPERFVRSIVPVLPGQILALLSGGTRSQVGFFDGERWHGYTLPDGTLREGERVVGLVPTESEGTFLVTTDHVLLVAPTGAGTAFVPTGSGVANVRSFRATLTPAASAPAPEEVSASSVLVATQALAVPPANAPSERGPALVARVLEGGIAGSYRALSGNGRAFAAVNNAGITELTRSMSGGTYRSRSLVHAEDLQLANGAGGEVWVRSADGDMGRFTDGRARRLPVPEDVSPQALATGRRGAYLIALVRGTSTVRVLTSTDTGFRNLVERTLEVPITGVPFGGVGPDGRVWLAMQIPRESGEGSRVRGVAVVDPDAEAVVYHHRGANREAGGLPLPDEVSGMTFDDAGNAWFATLSGAVRVEAHQAITFDETRGVRGDVVTDVAAAAGHMWIAAAEGLGTYADRTFDFVQPEIVMTHRPSALALDDQGHLWAGGRYGLLHYDGTDWTHTPFASAAAESATPGPSLPIEDIRDIEIDGAGRVWILAPDRILLLVR